MIDEVFIVIREKDASENFRRLIGFVNMNVSQLITLIDPDQNIKFSEKYAIEVLPTVLFTFNGEELFRWEAK
jgi:c-di-AMP phosphodiesterase-like protein